MTSSRTRFSKESSVVAFADTRGSAQIAHIDLEASLLGAILSDNAAWPHLSYLVSDDFSEESYAEVWETISGLLLKGRAATPGIVSQAMGARLARLGGTEFLADLITFSRNTTPALEDAATRLRTASQWRKLQALGALLSERIREGGMNPDEVASELITGAQAALEGGKPTARGKRDVAREAVEQAAHQSAPVLTGIEALDLVTQGGLVARRLYGLGGVFGRGKTILLGSISDNLNHQHVPHLFVSLETPPEDIEIRNCARHLDLNASQIFDQSHPLNKRFVKNASKYLEQLSDHTWYEFLPGASIDDIQRSILRAVHRHNVKGVIIDYWQLIRGREKGQGEDAHFREVANRLAALCRLHDIWIVLAAQTDDLGKPLYSQGILQAAALFVRLQRDPNDQKAFFTTEKSNYARVADGGNEDNPGLIFDLSGPHFRTPAPQDYALLGGLDEPTGS